MAGRQNVNIGENINIGEDGYEIAQVQNSGICGSLGWRRLKKEGEGETAAAGLAGGGGLTLSDCPGRRKYYYSRPRRRGRSGRASGAAARRGHIFLPKTESHPQSKVMQIP